MFPYRRPASSWHSRAFRWGAAVFSNSACRIVHKIRVQPFIARSGALPQRHCNRESIIGSRGAICCLGAFREQKKIDMRVRTAAITALSAVTLLAGCATQPLGPTIPAMPGPGKSMETFQQDDSYCQQYAADRAAGRVKQANDNELRNGVIGAALGAGIGALAGNTKGALIGGGVGGVLGSASGAGYDQGYVQHGYDIAYAQCMTARGDSVPGPRRRRPPPGYYGPPPPPPPPGY